MENGTWFRSLPPCVVFALLGFQPSVQGQTQGEITGEVTDASGGIVAGARVSLTSIETNSVRESVTNAAGVYRFPSLTPAQYSVKVEARGFRPVVRTGIELQVQQVARIDFALQLGSVSEAIEVTAAAPLMETENAATGTVIENRRIVEMPLNGRNFLQLVALSPNVTFGFASSGQAAGRQGGQRAQENISVAGQRSEFNHFTLDGVENTDPNFNTYVFLPSIDVLQEFKVQTGIYPAEFGREASQINVLTKSGTNAYHGALFEFLRNSKLDADSYSFTTVRNGKDPYKRNQYGFALGGPLRFPNCSMEQTGCFF
ncbi:MAG: carboxypeptidase regulatory-like domain-containing protein [Bryobacteraceae bacterium]